MPWWRQAQGDLEAARLNQRAGVFFVASWLAQQAAEKSLKAMYVERRENLPPRTHDLDYLGTELGAPASVLANLRRLNTAFDLVRYPDPATGLAPVDVVTSVRAQADMAAVEEVMQWVHGELSV